MESVSTSSDSPPKPSGSRFSHVVGVVVAVLTLMLPLLAIAHYSSADMPTLPNPNYSLPQPRE